MTSRALKVGKTRFFFFFFSLAERAITAVPVTAKVGKTRVGMKMG